MEAKENVRLKRLAGGRKEKLTKIFELGREI